MKILLTGASGFFGRSLIEAIKTNNEDVEIFCTFRSNVFNLNDDRFHWVECNLLDEKSVKKLMRELRPTHLVHLAWHVPPQKFWSAKENLDWLYASAKLFQEFCDQGGQVYVGAGTIAEYDWRGEVLDEIATPLTPNTLYGQCKKSLHEIIINLRNTYYPDTKIIWPRIGYFFGPHEPKAKLIPKLIENVKSGGPISLASADFKRPYAHVKYAGQVISNILFQNEYDDVSFNLSASIGYRLEEIVNFVQKILKIKSSDFEYGAYPSSPENLIIKTDFLKKKGWELPDVFFDSLAEFLLVHK